MTNIAEDFYLENKDYKSFLPTPPSEDLSDFELSNWLLNESDFAWLELDVDVDVKVWANEIEQCKDRLVNHRERDSSGWRSACIHGINVESTGSWNSYGYINEDEVPYAWTELADKCKSIKQFWDNFPYDSYRRIRIMEVTPNGYINPHSDKPGKLPGEENFDALKFGVPVNIAVVHPKDCFMTLKGIGCVPWEEGRAYIINIRNYHSVVNFSNQSRYHIIGHGKLDKKINEFTELVARSFKKQYRIENEHR